MRVLITDPFDPRRRPRPEDVFIETMVTTTPHGAEQSPHLDRAQQHIVALCDGRPQSLAEIAARMQLPLGVARLLVADMIASSRVAIGRAMPDDADPRRAELLHHLLGGLRTL
jgi:hypothetical protein